MTAAVQAKPQSRLLLSGNDAIARGVWEAGARVAAAYPGTPSTEILESLSLYPDLYAEWSVNEKVAMEVAIGGSMSGARSFCAMKHVGLNVASDAFMTVTVAGVIGGLVIAVADDVGMSSSQNEQDSRFWGRFAHVPVLEPADSQEAYEMAKYAFELSEAYNTPVILRLTTRVCHVKAVVQVGEKVAHAIGGFKSDARRWVMTPANAKGLLPAQIAREGKLQALAEASPLNFLDDGKDKRVGFVTSGPAFMHVRESFPDAPVLKLGFTYPVPLALVEKLAGQVEHLVVVEETEPLMERELKAAGLQKIHGKDLLPRLGELTPNVLIPAIKTFLGEPVPPATTYPKFDPFPRPPTMCAACPHMGVYYSLARMRKNVQISGDIGCYTLGAGHPWNALDSTISMGASMGIALGMDKARSEETKDKAVVAVIGDSTFLHMGMQGLLDIVYNRGNVTVLILDNRTTGMTGGQNHAGTGKGLKGDDTPRVDFTKLVEALGVNPERIKKIDPYQLPVVFKTIKQETAIPEVSVIITDRPCVLSEFYSKIEPYKVVDEDCTGCGNCINVGCPAITVKRSESKVRPDGKVNELKFTTIDTAMCTGCNMCVESCGPKAIVKAKPAVAAE
ncbi:Indolepyruvate oxidoreductase subunit IorA [Paramagnetospirillum magnetotacticum MS-1]|uniref:Indolepyruvate oxidoreductase subunit IorA n=1 Tax=Paramagnetospirillum magnetotacticum MS-1 TaxID=272627 RepID=A0A0C2V6U2_PARME|nr:thiamine pyrophosphate-dependent enzyme [Paramagnetospirillum magnetotacticum]KIM00772.1 Indolepyruvate oxidoreductase subunit IorA [Paramagnetospirillum magnetotacticum MS-1]